MKGTEEFKKALNSESEEEKYARTHKEVPFDPDKVEQFNKSCDRGEVDTVIKLPKHIDFDFEADAIVSDLPPTEHKVVITMDQGMIMDIGTTVPNLKVVVIDVANDTETQYKGEVI